MPVFTGAPPQYLSYLLKDRYTLRLKDMTQGTLICKLCTYTATNPTRQAVFEYDRLIRSIYTLKYLRDPQMEHNTAEGTPARWQAGLNVTVTVQ